MKNNQYLEKYGEKALELLSKKSFKQTGAELNAPQDSENQLACSKLGEKFKKSCSHKSLPRNSKSKSKLTVNQFENQYTFQKPLNLHCAQEKEKNRKKLLISGLSTPKNNRSARMTSGVEQRIQSSSTKKKAADLRISQKLNQAIHKHKTTKSIVKHLLECLDLISQHECKITKWVGQFKEVVYHIADQATYYRKKYKEEMLKTKKIQKDMDEMQTSFKVCFDKKRKPVQVVMIQQNQKLRQKINKLQQKLQNFQRKEMVLIQTIEKLRSNPKQTDTTTSLKKQENVASGKIKRQFYGHMDEDEEDDSQDEQQQKQ